MPSPTPTLSALRIMLERFKMDTLHVFSSPSEALAAYVEFIKDTDMVQAYKLANRLVAVSGDSSHRFVSVADMEDAYALAGLRFDKVICTEKVTKQGYAGYLSSLERPV